MAKFKFSSTKLKQELQRRQRDLRQKQSEFVITVPPILYFWYPQEFGSGQRLEAGPHPPTKIPQKTGLRPRAMVRKAIPDIRSVVGGAVRGAFQLLGRTATTVDTALAGAMEGAKAFIALSFKRELPGTRTHGVSKLGGRNAGDVFFELARVVKRDAARQVRAISSTSPVIPARPKIDT